MGERILTHCSSRAKNLRFQFGETAYIFVFFSECWFDLIVRIRKEPLPLLFLTEFSLKIVRQIIVECVRLTKGDLESTLRRLFLLLASIFSSCTAQKNQIKHTLMVLKETININIDLLFLSRETGIEVVDWSLRGIVHRMHTWIQPAYICTYVWNTSLLVTNVEYTHYDHCNVIFDLPLSVVVILLHYV